MTDDVVCNLANMQLDDWLASSTCQTLNARAQMLLQRDMLLPEDVDKINALVPEQYKELFWDRLALYFDEL